MKKTIKNIKNLSWNNEEKTSFDCEIEFNEIPEVFPFTASINDTTDYVVEIFERCVSGEFGSISDFVPKILTLEEMSAIERYKRDSLLQKMDSIISNPLRWNSFSEEVKSEWANYRQQLLDVPSQAGFPITIDWPVAPE